MSELKPCPFCGGKNVLSTELQDGLPFIAYCQCGAENEAENWNNRPIEDKLRKRIAELEAERRWRIIADGELPDDRATVLVAFTEYPEQIDILTATYYKRYEGFGGVDNWWDIEGWHSGNVTHWIPLPQPPEVKQ
jgi:hypothetical protein